MARAFYRFLIPLAVVVSVIGCTAQADVEPQRAPTLAGSLQPYQTSSPSAVPLTATPIQTRTPLPTATPHIYTVKSGDTMGSIALEFGFDIGDLVNANPDVPPASMSIGQELLIPYGDVASAVTAVEPLPLPFAAPECYATIVDGLWCFVLAQNSTEKIVEGISFNVQLYDATGTLVASELAFPLLDRLPAGEFIPALIYFDDMPVGLQAYAELKTAFEGNPVDENYPAVTLQGVLTQVAWDGLSAHVSGTVSVDESADEVWVLATAYGGDGKVLGARRWASVAGERDFSITVASLDAEIDHVSLSAEAHR